MYAEISFLCLRPGDSGIMFPDVHHLYIHPILVNTLKEFLEIWTDSGMNCLDVGGQRSKVKFTVTS